MLYISEKENKLLKYVIKMEEIRTNKKWRIGIIIALIIIVVIMYLY